jgi:hypothetical protein
VFDWTILKYQQSQTAPAGAPQRAIAAGTSGGAAGAGGMSAGGQDLQEIQRNGETAEGSRRRLSAGGLASGSMEASKHKSSGPDDTTTKEVNFLLFSVSCWTYHLFR